MTSEAEAPHFWPQKTDIDVPDSTSRVNVAPTPATLESSPDQAPLPRLGWVDTAKGLAIVLVVIGHAIDGVRSSGLTVKGGALESAQYLIYTFHMPAFFILSGLFVKRRLAANPSGFLSSLFTRIAWPYFLWGAIQALVISLAGKLVNVPADFSFGSILSMIWHPASQFWYLWALFLMHVSSLIIIPRWGLLTFVAFAMFCFGLPALVSVGFPGEQPFKFGIFYAAGIVMGDLQGNSRLRPGYPAQLKAGIALVWACSAVAALRSGQGSWTIAALPAAVAGSGMLIMGSTSRWLTSTRLLKKLGKASLVIYLLHIIFGSGARSLAHKVFGVDDGPLLVCVSVMAGIAFPTLIFMAVENRPTWARVLGLG